MEFPAAAVVGGGGGVNAQRDIAPRKMLELVARAGARFREPSNELESTYTHHARRHITHSKYSILGQEGGGCPFEKRERERQRKRERRG